MDTAPVSAAAVASSRALEAPGAAPPPWRAPGGSRNRCPVSGGFYRPGGLARRRGRVRPTGRWEKCIFHAVRKKNGQKRPRGARIRAARAFHRVVAAGGQPSGQPSGQPGWTGGSARGPARFGGWPGPISGVAGHSAGHLAGPLAGPRAGPVARGLARGPDAPSRRPSRRSSPWPYGAPRACVPSLSGCEPPRRRFMLASGP